jgi:hypothetical protein
MKVISNWTTLMLLAKKASLAQSQFDKNPNMETCKKLVEAKNKHRDYEQICLKSDEMVIPQINYGQCKEDKTHGFYPIY